MTDAGTIERARGRWQEILPRFGIGTHFLVNKHGPCPLCGGKDRFRFDDKDGSGSYYCGQCGPGPGIMLIRKQKGWNHATACQEIDQIIGNEYREPEKRERSDDREKRRLLIERTWRDANDAALVELYLAKRGLGVVSDSLRGHGRLWHSEARQAFPAILAPIFGPGGDLQSLQRIYVGAVEPRKMTLPPVDTITGGAVRLFEVENELGISEGVETALAAYQLFGRPTWATISESGMSAFEPPAGVTRFHIFGDNDANFVGQAAAYALAKRLVRLRHEVQVYIPPRPDTDWLDVLNEQERAA